uniref:CSON007681 protein n=1 Tax=Culicoides sonorensis TaxID=179676 RepID=A0A336LX16_CULSO
MKANIFINILILLAHLVQIFGLKCFKCNETERYTKKCVFDSSDEIECAIGEVCSFGRTVKSTNSPDLIGCETKENCDKDKANGIACDTCNTDLCNLYGRQVVTFENRVQVINRQPGTTIIKEEVLTRPGVANNNHGHFPGNNFPFFNMPNFGFGGFNNFGFHSQPSYMNQFFKPPGFGPTPSSSSYYPNSPNYQSQGNIPPYAPFVGPFGGPFSETVSESRPPFMPVVQELQPPIYVPPPPQGINGGQNEIENKLNVAPVQETIPGTLQETVYQFIENNNKAEATTETVKEEIPSTMIPIIEEEINSTSKPSSLATSLLEQFSTPNPSIETNRGPSISDLVLNLAANQNQDERKPSSEVETTTSEPIDYPVTIPEIIEQEIDTESPTLVTERNTLNTELPVNKDYIAIANRTDFATPNTSLHPADNQKNLISPTSAKTPLAARTNDEEDEVQVKNDEKKIQPDDLLFNIKTKLLQNENIKFPIVEQTVSGNVNSVTGNPILFESTINYENNSEDVPVFSKI